MRERERERERESVVCVRERERERERRQIAVIKAILWQLATEKRRHIKKPYAIQKDTHQRMLNFLFIIFYLDGDCLFYSDY